MRLFLLFFAASVTWAQQSPAEKLIEAGHWKRARAIVEARLRETPDDALSTFLLSQIRGAFGDRSTPLALAEKAVALDGRTAKYHRQVAEVLGVAAQRAGTLQLFMLGRRSRRELDTALSLEPNDLQAMRDLMEFYLLAPGILGGDSRKASDIAHKIVLVDAGEGLLARARIAEVHKNSSERKALLRQAIDARPPKYRAIIALSQFYLEAGHSNLHGAEAAAKMAMNVDPGRAGAYAVSAVVHAARADWTQLDSTLAASLREVPDDLTPLYRAAERLLVSGSDPARAERYLRSYLAQEPEGNQPSASEASYKQGRALEAQGHTADALAEFKQSVRLDPEPKAVQEFKRLRNAGRAVETCSARHM